MGYVRLNGSYTNLKSINFQVAGIPSLCKEKNMNMKSMSYTGKVIWTVWELDVEDYEILFNMNIEPIWVSNVTDEFFSILSQMRRVIYGGILYAKIFKVQL